MKKNKKQRAIDLNKITVIKVTRRTRERLKEFKYNERESYDAVINKMMEKITEDKDILLFKIGKEKKEKLL